MGSSIQLTDEEFDALDRLRFSTADAEVFRNCLIVLRSHAGCSIGQIADFLGCSADTVKRVRRLWRTGGIAALHPRDSPGRPSRASSEFRAQLRQAVKTCPLTLGYGFATWSSARLAEHLAQTTGVRFSDVAPRLAGELNIHSLFHGLPALRINERSSRRPACPGQLSQTRIRRSCGATHDNRAKLSRHSVLNTAGCRNLRPVLEFQTSESGGPVQCAITVCKALPLAR